MPQAPRREARRFAGRLEPAIGFEPTTRCLQNSRSTTELRRLNPEGIVFRSNTPRFLARLRGAALLHARKRIHYMEYATLCQTNFSGDWRGIPPMKNAAGSARERLILALDVPDLPRAAAWYERMQPYCAWFKVGLELFSAHGPAVFDHLPADRVFLDVKYHDIPNTVRGAARAAARMGVWMFNVHAAGGPAMLRAAREGARMGAGEVGLRPPLLIAVTVLSSLDQPTLSAMGVTRPIEDQVVAMARLAQDQGLDGVVASAPEVAAIRTVCEPGFVIMTPGIRPTGSERGDQKRVMTPAEAIRAGSTFLGIGRPVTAAPDPEAAIEAILDEVEAALKKNSSTPRSG